MTDATILGELPFARRHARMMLGRQDDGDGLLADTLRHLAGRSALRAEPAPIRLLLFRAMHHVLRRRPAPSWTADRLTPLEKIADRRLQAMPAMARAVLLLTAVEGFSDADAADILDIPATALRSLADEAQRDIERELETTVLIIEDEWAIARDLRRTLQALGHEVVGVAATETAAVELAAQHRPGLVVADLRLADGSSGADAALTINRAKSTPTVFVTAYPAELLQSPRRDPTYLITKPFSAAMVKTTVSQALFFS